jgi:hypothetical protein
MKRWEFAPPNAEHLEFFEFVGSMALQHLLAKLGESTLCQLVERLAIKQRFVGRRKMGFS